MILKWVIEKCGGSVWTAFISLGTGGRIMGDNPIAFNKYIISKQQRAPGCPKMWDLDYLIGC
jgi:hypothetical protein